MREVSAISLWNSAAPVGSPVIRFLATACSNRRREEELRPRFPRLLEEFGDFPHGLFGAHLLRWCWNNLRYSRGRIWRWRINGKFDLQRAVCAEASSFGISSRCADRSSKLGRARGASSCVGSDITPTCAFA